MVQQVYKDQCAAAAAPYCDKGFTPANDSGDVSIKDPATGYIYIWPRPSKYVSLYSWRVLKPENICVVDGDGNLIEDNGMLPTVEMPMHLAIYKARPEINAIIHSHPLYSSVYAVAWKDIPAVLAEQALFLGGDIICAKYGRVGSKELGEYIVEALGEKKMAALLRNHGAVAIGRDLTHAFICADYLERNAHVCIMAESLGGSHKIDLDNIKDPSLLKHKE